MIKRSKKTSFFVKKWYNKYEKYELSYERSYMKDKFIGIARVGEKGQIVIPKEARDMFNINPGDSIIVLCDKERGIALLKSDFMEDSFNKIMGGNE